MDQLLRKAKDIAEAVLAGDAAEADKIRLAEIVVVMHNMAEDRCTDSICSERPIHLACLGRGG
jgi:hypothetical protein